MMLQYSVLHRLTFLGYPVCGLLTSSCQCLFGWCHLVLPQWCRPFRELLLSYGCQRTVVTGIVVIAWTVWGSWEVLDTVFIAKCTFRCVETFVIWLQWCSGMLRPRGLCGLEAKLFSLGLVVSGLGLVASGLGLIEVGLVASKFELWTPLRELSFLPRLSLLHLLFVAIIYRKVNLWPWKKTGNLQIFFSYFLATL